MKMKSKNTKNIMAMIIGLMLVAGIFATLPLTANAAEKTVYLKGNSNSFNESGWQNIQYLGGAELMENPSIWHLVATPSKETATVTYMQLTFTNGYVFEWNTELGFSTNGGGNNPCWVIAAPANWELDYIDRGNNHESGCHLITNGNVNNFNVSGYHKGVGTDPFIVPEYGLAGLAALATCFAALLVFYATKNKAKARTYNTNTIPTSI
jgi:hypothetical protein